MRNFLIIVDAINNNNSEYYVVSDISMSHLAITVKRIAKALRYHKEIEICRCETMEESMNLVCGLDYYYFTV